MGWLTGWGRRKKQTITGSTIGTQTDYQKKMIVHKGSGSDSSTDVYCGGNCRDDFGDIRWTKDDGTTPMDYWIEELVSGDYAVFWVEIPSVPASPDTIDCYIYYDKSDEATTSNGDNTFIFHDHFPGDSLNLDKWTIDTGSPSVSGSILTLYRTGGLNVRIHSDIATGPFERAYRMKMRITGINGGEIWLVDSSYNGVAAKYYTTHKAGSQKSGSEWTDYSKSGGSWYIYGFRLPSASVQKFDLDDVEDVSHTRDLTGTGEIVIRPMANDVNGAQVDIDWVLMRKYISPEPSWGDWGSEETEEGTKYATINSNARIKVPTIKTIVGTARIKKTSSQTVAGNATVVIRKYKTIGANARIKIMQVEAIASNARIKKKFAETITGTARIEVPSSAVIDGTARIEVPTSKMIAGTARIKKPFTQTITGNTRIQTTPSVTIDSTARIKVLTQKTIIGNAKITMAQTYYKIIEANARIKATQAETMTGNARIKVISTQTIIGNARILIEGIKKIWKSIAEKVDDGGILSKVDSGKMKIIVDATKEGD